MSELVEQFDAESVYDERIFPLMKQIIEICKANKIPMVASFNYASDGEGDEAYCTTFLHFESRRPDSYARAVRIIRPPQLVAMTITTERDP